MAHLLRGKQAGVQNDLSAGITSASFGIDDINRFGINSQISQLAYDPVQSLLAVGTTDTKFGYGQIYVFGQKRVAVVFNLPSKASVRALQFCADRLLCLDTRNDFTIYSLETKRKVVSYAPPGKAEVLHSDPTLDYALLGMQNGDILAFDLDRETLAPLRIQNLLREHNPRARSSSVVSLQFHPRDIGTLLIGYSEAAVIYSFKQNKSLKVFHYQLPRGAPGGDSDPASVNLARTPRLTQALWHPTGTFILTGHEDSSLVFWDAWDGRMLMARTLSDTHVDKPGSGKTTMGATPGTFAVKEPLFRIAWCANQDPEDTAILVAGGAPTNMATKGLTFFEMGRTPMYATSKWEVFTQFFESPKRQRILPTPPNAEVVDFCLIPRSTPHFAGAHDPIAALALLSSGEVISLSIPSGLPISPTNQLSINLTFVHPFVNRIALAPIERTRWLGMTEKRSQGPLILKGGKEANHPLKRFEGRNIVQTAHADGSIRLWDAGHGDEIENDNLVQADVARAVGRFENIQVSRMSLAGATGELAVGLQAGELLIMRWGTNKTAGREPPEHTQNTPRALTNIVERRDPALREGLLPFTLLDQQDGPVSAVKLSDVGFVAAGFEGGSLAVIDLRGPAIIYNASVNDFMKSKGGSFRRHSQQASGKPEWPTIIEFSVMMLEGDDYSSILLHVGTNLGNLATFKLLPEASGRYTVQFAGSNPLDDRVVAISPLNAGTGRPAYASQSTVAGLRTGLKVDGVVLAVTQSGARIFKPATHKGAHKTWDNVFCDSAAVAQYEDSGHALIGLFGDGTARAYSIPGLKEIAGAKVEHIFDRRRFGEAMITSSGDILGWTGPSETALINIWGSGLDLNRNNDTLLNPELLIPPRPTISNMQWIAGVQHVTPADMDILIGGPDRPPSKRMIAQMRADEAQFAAQGRAAARAGTASSSSTSAAQQSDETYYAWMSRQIQERTEKMGIMGDSMDRLEQNSSGWADDVSKFVGRQKKNLVMGVVKSKLGI